MSKRTAAAHIAAADRGPLNGLLPVSHGSQQTPGTRRQDPRRRAQHCFLRLRIQGGYTQHHRSNCNQALSEHFRIPFPYSAPPIQTDRWNRPHACAASEPVCAFTDHAGTAANRLIESIHTAAACMAAADPDPEDLFVSHKSRIARDTLHARAGPAPPRAPSPAHAILMLVSPHLLSPRNTQEQGRPPIASVDSPRNHWRTLPGRAEDLLVFDPSTEPRCLSICYPPLDIPMRACAPAHTSKSRERDRIQSLSDLHNHCLFQMTTPSLCSARNPAANRCFESY